MKKLGLSAGILIVTAALLFADPVQLVSSARENQSAENWYTAIEYYQEALLENPSYYLAYRGLSECFYALGEYEQALTNIEQAIRLKKDDPELINLKGFISIGLGDIDSAVALFSQVLSLWPNDISARFGLAEIEVYTGRISTASDFYRDALARNPQNRKALLSLALVSDQYGDKRLAREYIEKALRFHGENPQVFYFAAYLAVQDNRMNEAEKYVRRAISLNGGYDTAKELLAVILFRAGRYNEVVDVCNQRIQANRDCLSAWYMKSLALEKKAQYEDSLDAARTGLEIVPDDAVLRALMELTVIEQLPFEDARRKQWSRWHIERARLFEQKNLAEQALFEYRQALKIYPDDAETRYSYAKLLLARGYPAGFLSQLEFIHSLGRSNTVINDSIESYTRLLSSSVHRKWGIDQLFLEKAHTRIGFFYRNDSSNILHPDSERITAAMLAQAFTYNPRFIIHNEQKPVTKYSDAFRISRERGDDYFILLSYDENERDIRLSADVYVSSTGTKAETFTVFRTGNNRYPNALRKMTDTLIAAFPLNGTIIERRQSDAVIDLGKADGIEKDMVFDIVAPADLRSAGNEIALVYGKGTVLGTFTVTDVDEEIAQGKVARSGFYDRIKKGDAVILSPAEEDTDKNDSADDTDSGKPAPSLFRLLRQIR